VKLLALLALGAAMCTPSAPPAPPAPSQDAGASAGGAPYVGPESPIDACARARQHMVELSCPPDEDAHDGWVIQCSGWSHASVMTSCIDQQTTCLGTRQCLGENP